MSAEGGGPPGKQTARKQTGQLIAGRSAPKDSLEEFMAKNDADEYDEDDSEGEEVSNSHQYDDEDDDYDEDDDDDPAGPFTRDELESMDKEELISIILTHQDRIFGRQLYNSREGPTSSSRHGNGIHDIDDEDDVDDEGDIDEEGFEEEEDEGSEAVEKTSSSTSPIKRPSEAIAVGEDEGSAEASSSDVVSSTKRHKSE